MKYFILFIHIYALFAQTIDQYRPPSRCSKVIKSKFNSKVNVNIATIDSNCDGIGKVGHRGKVYRKSEIFPGQNRYFSLNNKIKNINCVDQAIKQSFVDCRVKFDVLVSDYKDMLKSVSTIAQNNFSSSSSSLESFDNFKTSSDFKNYCIEEYAVCGTSYAIVGLREQKNYCNYLIQKKESIEDIHRCAQKLNKDAKYIQKYLGKLSSIQKAKEEKRAGVTNYFNDLNKTFGKYKDDFNKIFQAIDKISLNKKIEENNQNAKESFELCQNLVDKDGNDINQRKLARLIITEVDSPNCQYDPISHGDGVKAALKLANDIRKLKKKQVFTQLNSELNLKAVTQSARALWRLNDRFYGARKGSRHYFNLIKKYMPDTFSHQSSLYKKAIEQEYNRYKNEHPDGLERYSDKYWNKGALELSKSAKKINRLCAAAKKDFTEGKLNKDASCHLDNSCGDQFSHFIYNGSKGLSSRYNRETNTFSAGSPRREIISTTALNNFADQRDEKYSSYNQIHKYYYKEIMNEYYKIISSDLSYLLVTKGFGDKFGVIGRGRLKGEGLLGSDSSMVNGDWLMDRCFKDSQGSMMHPSFSGKELEDAKTEFFNLAAYNLTSVDNSHSNDLEQKAEHIKEYLKSNPAVIRDFLNENDDPDYYTALCSLIRDINDDDEKERNKKAVLAGFGIASGIVLMATGLGAEVGAPILLASLGAAAGTSVAGVYNSSVGIEIAEREQKQLAASYALEPEKNLDEIIREMGKSEAEISGHQFWRSTAIVGLILTPAKVAQFAKNLKRMTTMTKMVKLADGVDDESRSENFVKAMQQGLKRLKSISGLKFPNSQSYSDIFTLGMLGEKLQESSLIRLFDQLDELDEGQITEFLKKVRSNPDFYLGSPVESLNFQNLHELLANIKRDKLPDGTPLLKASKMLEQIQ